MRNKKLDDIIYSLKIFFFILFNKMGQTESINIVEKSDGIFEIDVKDYPNYPIAYLRLCFDNYENKYCVPEFCSIKHKNSERKIIVVGMRIPGISGINEQAFYQSTGQNSLETLIEFFNIDDLKIDKDNADIWIPFSGIGHPNIDDYNNDINNIKLFKNYFNGGFKSMYGRFGDYSPNLIQISYCLGGKFWEYNSDKFLDEKLIEKMPFLTNTIKKLPYYYVYEVKDFDDIIECAKYLNNYIGSAIVLNYSPELKKYISLKNCKKCKNPLKVDWRILNILLDKKYIYTKTGLASENMFSYDFWDYYIYAINKLRSENEFFFQKNIIPIINDNIGGGNVNKKKIKKEKDDITEKEKDDITEKEKDDNILGTKNNPHIKKKDAGVNEYYIYGKKIYQRHI